MTEWVRDGGIDAVMHVIRADQGLEAGLLPLGRELTRQRSQRS